MQAERRNYQGELTPTTEELIRRAEATVRQIGQAKPVRVGGNLVGPGTREYLGSSYFADVEKNTWNHRSRQPNDFSGLYVFFDIEEPMYVGISRTVIRRLKQHLFSDKENQATLAFLIARVRFEEKYGAAHQGGRKSFPFKDNMEEVKSEILSRWKFATVPLSGGYELAFTEIFVGSALGCRWNSFDTH